MGHLAYVALGSNLGDREANLRRALELMGQSGIRVAAVSRFLESEPYGVTDQPKFVNAVARVETELEPVELLDTLLGIENTMGRVRLRHWGERNIDLDLLLYDDVRMRTEKLTLPHPDMQNRDFVMKPLAEIRIGNAESEFRGGWIMQKNVVCGVELSRLGFGTMRLPVLPDKSIDQEQLDRMVAYALEHGVNYFDTAYPYMDGKCEAAVGRALAKHPRDLWHLATKFPGHQIADKYDPAEVFEDQLKTCGVEYFDFYLLHNVYENSIPVYEDPKWGILDYFKKQRELGRIKHLGMSSHARPETLEKFLDKHGKDLEFVQIQLNYLDWTLQKAQEKYEIITAHNLPVWVMEPVRGGKLAKLPGAEEAKLKALRPEDSIAAWGFRWLMGLENVKMILSGMSNEAQMADNVKTFSGGTPLSEEEGQLLLQIAEPLKNAVPCTACRYCCSGCPKGLDIPFLIARYNDMKYELNFNSAMQMDTIPFSKWPTECLQCGRCAKVCPQNIDIPKVMRNLTELLERAPKWAEICKERAAQKAKK